MNYIDAHVHVWTDNFQHYPLAEGIAPERIKPATFHPEEIARHARPSGVKRIVLIQVSYYRFDNAYMLDVIASDPKVFRGVAIVDWNAKDPAAAMRALKPRGVRGFRVYPGSTSPQTWLNEAGFSAMFRCAADEHLAVCPLINPEALPALSRMCQRFPSTPIIIDHLARIGADGQIREADIRSLCGLARHREVRVKVSAFYALGEKKPPHLDLAPLIRRVFEAFGSRRLMWASDCPFQVANETYEDSLSLIRDRLDFLTRDDRDWILRKTAESFFFRPD